MKISKIEAAQRQLDAAIRLFLAEDDWISIHTLAAASFRILRDLGDQQESWALDKIIGHIPLHERKAVWRDINRVANFLKHADQDPTECLSDIDIHINDHFICAGCMLCADLAKVTPTMVVFSMWYWGVYPDSIDLDALGDAEARGILLKGALIFEGLSRSQQLALVRDVLPKVKDTSNGADATLQ